MIRKMNKYLMSFVFFSGLSVCLLNDSLRAMDRDEKNTSITKTISPVIKNNPSEKEAPLNLKAMSREDLENLVRAQQKKLADQSAILSGMTLEEQKIAQLLNTRISDKASELIELLSLGEQTNPHLEKCLDLFTENPSFKERTIRDVLMDKAIPESIARKLFRGVLCGIEKEHTVETGTLNLGRFQHLNRPETFDAWIESYLVKQDHISKILCHKDSFTDQLIQKYLSIRGGGAIAILLPNNSYKHWLF